MWLRNFLLVAFSLVVAGCAAARLDAMSNPEFIGRQYRTVLAHADITDLGLRKRAEARLCREVEKFGAYCGQSHTVFFPGRKYSDDEISEKLRERAIEAILFVTPDKSGVEQTYVPPSYHTEWSEFSSGGLTTGSATTREYGGRVTHKPWASFTVRLLDAESQDVAWVGTADVGGDAYADFYMLVDALASRVAEQLNMDGFIE